MTTNEEAPIGLPAPEDEVYDPGAEPLEGEHGSVIWSRALPSDSAAALVDARVNELVLYRSRDVHGKPIARLYAAGELGSSFGHLYLSGGNIAECFVTGHVAGRGAASLAPLDT